MQDEIGKETQGETRNALPEHDAAEPGKPPRGLAAARGGLRSAAIWVALYLVMLAAIGWIVERGRQNAVQIYGTAEAQREWDEWRAEAKRQSEGDGPVRRREQAEEPPALVLMRDYYFTCLAAAWLLGTGLFLSMMVFVRGVTRSEPFAIRPD